jgi:hypothetical protein
MKTRGMNLGVNAAAKDAWLSSRPAYLPGRLQMVTARELEELRSELRRGTVPRDLEAKLGRLAVSELGHVFIAQNCRLIIELLGASEAGMFKQADRAGFERLLRVLAYVRKDDDAIPDSQPGGFVDDQEEVRVATTELKPLLQAFKAWRLQHQVPAMWRLMPPGYVFQPTTPEISTLMPISRMARR